MIVDRSHDWACLGVRAATIVKTIGSWSARRPHPHPSPSPRPPCHGGRPDHDRGCAAAPPSNRGHSYSPTQVHSRHSAGLARNNTENITPGWQYIAQSRQQPNITTGQKTKAHGGSSSRARTPPRRCCRKEWLVQIFSSNPTNREGAGPTPAHISTSTSTAHIIYESYWYNAVIDNLHRSHGSPAKVHYTFWPTFETQFYG